MEALRTYIFLFGCADLFRHTFSLHSFISYPEITKLGFNSKFCSVKITRQVNYCPLLQREDEINFAGLVRLDGVKVGHVREINVVPGVTHKMRTLAMKPLMFEIPDFLSAEHCDYIIEMAKKASMFSSTTMAEKPRPAQISIPFHVLDTTEDGVITVPELRDMAKDMHRLYLDNNELIKMFDDLNITAFYKDSCFDSHDQCRQWAQEGECRKNPSYMLYRCRRSCANCDCQDKFQNCSALASQQECFGQYAEWMLQNCAKSCNICIRGIPKENFHSLDTMALNEYLVHMKSDHPVHRARFSNQTWLYRKQDPLLEDIYEREVKLTQLPRDIMEGAEAFQVVGYGKSGHYHAHYDSFGPTSNTRNITCCHQVDNTTASCKLCRLITILYYLNDVTSGGETAFPLAGNKTLNITAFEERENGDRYNLSKFCHHANLVVKPKRGTAIMWYSHHLDEENTWLGEMDPYSLHGGCDIHEGEKWIINHWITAPYKHSAHMESIYDQRFLPDAQSTEEVV